MWLTSRVTEIMSFSREIDKLRAKGVHITIHVTGRGGEVEGSEVDSYSKQGKARDDETLECYYSKPYVDDLVQRFSTLTGVPKQFIAVSSIDRSNSHVEYFKNSPR